MHLSVAPKQITAKGLFFGAKYTGVVKIFLNQRRHSSGSLF
jgi:hypothetical protein